MEEEEEEAEEEEEKWRHSITKGKYRYIHSIGNRGHTEAVDAHHVMLRNNASPKASIFLLAFLLLSACSCSLILQGRSVAFLPWSLIVMVLIIRMYRKLVVRESVIILPGLGVQLEAQYKSGRIDHRFVPTSKILKPILSECVTPVTCYWSLSLLIHGEEQLLVVFKEFHPPVKILAPIWKALCASNDCEEHEASIHK